MSKDISLGNNKLVRIIVYPFLNLQRLINKAFYRYTHASAQIKKLKNTHIGERCFIIGNGPSLNETDLSCLKGEFCFGFNRIFELFDSTDWRPSIYMCIDKNVLQDSITEINELDMPIFLLRNRKIAPRDNITWIINYVPFRVNRYSRVDIIPFSTRPDLCIYGGATVTFSAMQLAVYMGFEKIYLLGIDHQYSHYIDSTGHITVDENIKDYFGKLKTMPYTLQAIDTVNAAYHSAEKYANENNVGIYNATRGGKLEIFPRVKLEEILENSD